MTASGQKHDKSLEWGVSVVRNTWLFAMGRSGFLQPDLEHRHNLTVPAATNLGPNHTAKTGSTSNMSAVFDLHETVDFARIRSGAEIDEAVSAVSVTAKPTSLQSSSPPRKLKPTPTHIDENPSPSSVLAGGGIVDMSHALSPPTLETERLLNQASPLSIDAKVSRTTSAPATLSPRGKWKGESPVLKAATMGGLHRDGRKEDMTEVLRQLAQTDQSTTGVRAKLVRVIDNQKTITRLMQDALRSNGVVVRSHGSE